MPLREDKIARRLSRSMNTKPPALLRRAAAQFNQTLEPTGMSAPDLPLRRRVVVAHRLPVAQLFRSA
jgi:hypothetical protein